MKEDDVVVCEIKNVSVAAWNEDSMAAGADLNGSFIFNDFAKIYNLFVSIMLHHLMDNSISEFDCVVVIIDIIRQN